MISCTKVEPRQSTAAVQYPCKTLSTNWIFTLRSSCQTQNFLTAHDSGEGTNPRKNALKGTAAPILRQPDQAAGSTGAARILVEKLTPAKSDLLSGLARQQAGIPTGEAKLQPVWSSPASLTRCLRVGSCGAAECLVAVVVVVVECSLLL
jgi:hypothetical protein